MKRINLLTLYGKNPASIYVGMLVQHVVTGQQKDILITNLGSDFEREIVHPTKRYIEGTYFNTVTGLYMTEKFLLIELYIDEAMLVDPAEGSEQHGTEKTQ